MCLLFLHGELLSILFSYPQHQQRWFSLTKIILNIHNILLISHVRILIEVLCRPLSSFVLPDTSRKSRQKTRVLRRTVDPVFNHTMVYDGIKDADLAEACVELTVWDRDRLASNLLGGLRLGIGTGKAGRGLCQDTQTELLLLLRQLNIQIKRRTD